MKERSALLVILIPVLYLLGYPAMLFAFRQAPPTPGSPASYMSLGGISLVTGGSPVAKKVVDAYRPMLKLHARATGQIIWLRSVALG